MRHDHKAKTNSKQREPLMCDGEGHEHHHHDEGDCCCRYHETLYHKPDYKKLVRVITGAVLFIAGHILHGLELYLSIAAAVIAGYDIAIKAVVSAFRGRIFSEYFLMTFVAVFCCLAGEAHEAAAVVILYRIGDFFQECALRFSRRKIIEIRPDMAADVCTPSSAEEFLTKFSGIYTPVILICAVLVAIFGPIVGLFDSLADSAYAAMSFLVIACPCAVVISVPLAYSAGIAAGARKGVFFAEAPMVDSLAKTKPGEVYERKVQLLEGEGVLVCTKRYADISTAEAIVVDYEGGCAYFARKIARKIKFIALENIWFVILVKLAVIYLAVRGISPLWFAIFADAGVSVLAVLNSLRALLVRK